VGRKRQTENSRLGEHLQRRSGGIIELRFPIPPDVRHAFPNARGAPRALFIQSMGTTDVRLANDRADPIRADIKQRIARARSATSGDALAEYLRWLYRYETSKLGSATPKVTAEAARRRAMFGLDEDEGAEVVPHPSGGLAARLRAGMPRQIREDMEAGLERWHGATLFTTDPEKQVAVAGWAADFFFEQTIGTPPAADTPAYREVLDECLAVLQDAQTRKVDVREGLEPGKPLHPALNEAQVSTDGNEALTAEGRLTVRDYYERVFEPTLTKDGKRIGERSLPERAFAIERFIDLQGNKRLYQITKSDIWEFHDKLLRLPKTSELKDGWRQKPASEVLRAVDSGLKLGEPMSPKTVNKSLTAISTMLRYAEKRRHIKLNVAFGVRAEVQDDEEPGRPFEAAELNRIFQQPMFTGSMVGAEKRGRIKAGPVVVRDDAFWIPVVLFLTGARASEIVGLHCDDVVVDCEVPHFLIVENEYRRLKNPQSERMVPMHRYLIEAGFLTFAADRKKAGGRFFPAAKQEFTRDRRTGAMVPKSLANSPLMRQFNRTVLKRANATENRGSVKCFRNTFEEEAFNHIRDEEIRLRLTGRTIKNSSKVYKRRIPTDPEGRLLRLRTLKDAIDQMTFDKVDISRIRGIRKS
jgi:integrase